MKKKRKENVGLGDERDKERLRERLNIFVYVTKDIMVINI